MPKGSPIFKDFFQWLREATTPAALWDSLKTAVWVVPLTVMIWVYASQQQPLSQQNESILVDISSGSPNRVVTVGKGDDIPTATLSGAKTNLDQVITKLNEPGDKRWVHIVVPSDLPPGKHDLNIGDEIARADIFTSAGIKVTKVQPARIEVTIDEMQTQEVPITTAPNPNLVDTPIFDHQTATITAPKSAFDQAGKNASLAFVQIPTTGESPGTHSNVPLKVLTLLAGDNVTISPTSVSATFTVKQSDVTWTDPSIPIRRSFAPGINTNEYKVEAENLLTNVILTGPPDQINRIKNNDVSPYAELMIDSDDLNASNKQATLIYNLKAPDVQPVDKKQLNITFSVHPVSPAP